MKKVFSAVMVIVMVISMLPAGMILSSAATSGDYTYTVANSEATITKYNGTGGSVTIPDKFGIYNVTTIDSGAFSNCTGLTSLKISDNVKTIGRFAFDFCSNLTTVSIGNGVSTIVDCAFRYCPKLTLLTVKSSNSNFYSEDNVVFNKAKTILVFCAGGKDGNYIIPETVTEISESAFYGCVKLTGIEMQSGLKSIGISAFEECSGLLALSIPDSVIEIGKMAFFLCSGLKSIKIGSGITTIANDVFHNCTGLTSLTFGSNVTSIGGGAFIGCSGLTTLNLPDSLLTISYLAFMECDGLKEVIIPNSVAAIGSSAFAYCNGLIKVTIGDHVAAIDNRAFTGCKNLTSAYFLGDAPILGSDVFLDCASAFTVFYFSGKTDFTSPWNGYPTAIPSYSTIIFNANGGTGGTSTPMLPGSALIAPIVTKTDYILTGWTPAVPATVPYTSTTYTAQWSTYLVSFDAQGGSVSQSSKTVTNGSTYGALPTPKKTDYVFLGWYTSPEGAGTQVFSTSSATISAPQTLYAFWIPVMTSTVTFDAQDGSVSPATKEVTSGDTYGLLPVPTKTGWTFGGWFTNTNGGGINIYSTTMVTITSVQTLYAKWNDINTCLLTFDAQGGLVSPVTKEIKSGSTYGTFPEPTRTGYVFYGWFTLPRGSAGYRVNGNNKVTSSHSIYAWWTAQTYKVSFEKHGGTGSAVARTVTYGSTYETLPVLTKADSDFGGWWTCPGGAGEKIVSTDQVSILDAQTLYAKWIPLSGHSIVFDATGGTGGMSYAMDAGDTLSAPTVAKTGYSFNGWSPEVPATVPSTDATYYALWAIKSYTITFNAADGTGLALQIIQDYNTSVSLPSIGFTKTGFTFIGWNTEPDAETALSSYFVPGYNETLYAVYSMNYYSLTLKLNNGTNSNFASFSLPYSTSVNYNCYYFHPYDPYDPYDPWDPIPIDPWDPNPYNPNLYYISISYPYWYQEPPIGFNYNSRVTESYGYAPPARTGYDFVGWSESPSGLSTVNYTNMPAADKTLYAVWTEHVPALVMIDFNANGGTGGKIIQMVEGASLTPPIVARTGYSFIGWSPEVPDTVPAHDAIYTAEWEINYYMITFDANGGTGGTENLMVFGDAINAPAVSKTGCFLIGWSQAIPATVGAEDANFTALWNLFGDIGNDGQISVTDALTALQAASGFITLTATQLLAADTNNSNSVTIVDALRIMQFASGQITSF